jgi:hypothetical protein
VAASRKEFLDLLAVTGGTSDFLATENDDLEVFVTF